MSVIKDIEADSLFQLITPVGSPELNVRDVNNLLQKLDNLGTPKLPEIEEKEEKAEDADKLEKVDKVIEVQPVVFQRPPAKRRSFIAANSTPLRERVLKKVTPDEFRARKMIQTPVYAQTMTTIEKSSESRVVTPKRQARTPPSFELECFPNNKKSIGLDEFSNLCNDALVNQPIQDDILMKCFSIFDYNKKGYIESKVIKDIFMLFNEQVSEEDIQTLLKFLGCSDDGMTFDELKMFFKNNL